MGPGAVGPFGEKSDKLIGAAGGGGIKKLVMSGGFIGASEIAGEKLGEFIFDVDFGGREVGFVVGGSILGGGGRRGGLSDDGSFAFVIVWGSANFCISGFPTDLGCSQWGFCVRCGGVGFGCNFEPSNGGSESSFCWRCGGVGLGGSLEPSNGGSEPSFCGRCGGAGLGGSFEPGNVGPKPPGLG